MTGAASVTGMYCNGRLESVGFNEFSGYIRWLLHSPGVTHNPVHSSMREEKGHGIVASYR